MSQLRLSPFARYLRLFSFQNLVLFTLTSSPKSPSFHYSSICNVVSARAHPSSTRLTHEMYSLKCQENEPALHYHKRSHVETGLVRFTFTSLLDFRRPSICHTHPMRSKLFLLSVGKPHYADCSITGILSSVFNNSTPVSFIYI